MWAVGACAIPYGCHANLRLRAPSIRAPAEATAELAEEVRVGGPVKRLVRRAYWRI